MKVEKKRELSKWVKAQGSKGAMEQRQNEEGARAAEVVRCERQGCKGAKI